MNVSIEFDHEETIFTNGETVFGNIHIYCPNTSVVSNITATLIGESASALTKKTGLLISRKEKEKHRFVHESQVIVPWLTGMDNPHPEPLILRFGYHSFRFGLKLPWFPECCTCPPNSPVSQYRDDLKESSSRRSKTLPPSLMDVIKDAEISYRVDVAVTTVRGMFKTLTRKSVNINVWPMDTQSLSVTLMPRQSFPCKKSIQTSILGPPESVPSQESSRDVYLISTISPPANILVTAAFLPEFTLTRHREIAMRLSVKKLFSLPYDLYLQSFQMLLMGYTNIQAGTATSEPMNCWTIQSLSNLGHSIFHEDEEDELGTEHEVNPKLWEGKRMPGDVVPTFEGCNLGRRYELEIMMGFQCRGSKNQIGRVLFVQLRVPVRITSGIGPGRQIEDTKGIGEELPLTLDNATGVANGFEHRGIVERDTTRRSQPGGLSTPPTYEEAIRAVH